MHFAEYGLLDNYVPSIFGAGCVHAEGGFDVQLNYTITQEHYEDVIAFQLKLQRSKRRSLIQYIVTNAIFIILAVYFLVTHPESSVWSRLGVMGMAAAMLVPYHGQTELLTGQGAAHL